MTPQLSSPRFEAALSEPTVFIVDDDSTLRMMVRGLLESIELKTEQFSCAETFLKSFDPDRPGCLLLDLKMPGMGGLQLQKELIKRMSLLPVIIMTAHADVSVAVTTVKAGAVEFFEKPFSAPLLIDAVQRAIKQNHRELVQKRRAVHESIGFKKLTGREMEVLDLLTQGMANKAIGVLLGISTRTVETHRARVMEKMSAHSLAELVRISLTCQGMRRELNDKAPLRPPIQSHQK